MLLDSALRAIIAETVLTAAAASLVVGLGDIATVQAATARLAGHPTVWRSLLSRRFPTAPGDMVPRPETVLADLFRGIATGLAQHIPAELVRKGLQIALEELPKAIRQTRELVVP